ncbi:MAG: radical SAM protein [Geobacteraceae bacterium]|nr:radical SAM protein [Geobacteraceae bacterium]
MKIFLVNPHSSNWTQGSADNSSVAVRSAPVGLLSISAFLKRSGHDVRIIDLSSLSSEFSKKRFIDLLHSFRPDIVGFTAVTSNFLNGIQLAELVKSSFPDTGTVFGGVHVSALRGVILEKFRSIDMIVAGEGEEAMAEITSGAPCASIKGLIYRDGDAIKDNGARGLLCDLDSLPFPDYHGLDGFPVNYEGALFNYPKGPVATVISSRGCPYTCSYCDRSVFGSSFRYNSPRYLYEQMVFLKSEFGINHVFFYDDLFTFNRARIEEFCRLLREKPLGMTFNCAVRVGHIDDDLLKMLKASGCWMVSLGVESGSPEILARHKSNVDFDEMKKTVKRIRRAGLRAKGLFMMGLPGETEQTFRMTADFIHALELDDMNLTKFTPFPGSPLYKTIHDEGAFDEKWELMNCMNFVFVPHGMPSKERMDELYREFIRNFYTGKNWIRKFPGLMFKSTDSVKRVIRHLPAFLRIRREFTS